MEKIKFINTGQFHVYILRRLNHCWEQTRLFRSSFHVSTNSRLTLAGAFRGDYVAACSTAFRSATE